MANRFALLALACLFACKSAPPNQVPDSGAVPREYDAIYTRGLSPEAMANIPYDSISLIRQPCFGSCPEYTVTLRRDGKATYSGKRNVTMMGEYTSEIDPNSFGRLAYMLDDLGFMALDSSYAAPWTDDATVVIVAARRPEGVKRVQDYGRAGPIRLWTMQNAIDGVANRLRWVRDSI